MKWFCYLGILKEGLSTYSSLVMYKGAECYVDLLVPYPADNSDSPSVVELSQQGIDSSCCSYLFLISGSAGYPMPYASCLSSCCVVWR